jgi:hypothetical protein
MISEVTPLKKYSNKAYISIDFMPIYYWQKITETGDLTLLQKNGKLKNSILEDIWMNLNNQYFKEFGISSDYQSYLNKSKELVVKECELALGGNPFLKTEIKIIKADIDMLKQTTSETFSEILVLLEKFFGFPIDEFKCSVKKYYCYLRTASKKNP